MGRRPAIGGGRRILEDPARARFCFISPGLCIALIVAPQELGAQGGEAQREVTYSVPKAPAFHLIGASPSDVGRPGSPRELAVSLLSAVDSAGRLQQGFALEFSPGLALSGSVDANEYRTDFWKRLVARTGLSLGTAKASGGGSGTRMAVGGRAVLVDRTDPMVYGAHVDSLAEAMLPCLVDDLTEDDLTEEEAGVCARERTASLRARKVNATWNRATLSVGVAWGLHLGESRVSEAKSFGTAAWAVGTLPL